MARGDVEATIHIEGLGAFRRDLKRLAPEASKELKRDLKNIASGVASEAQSLMGARSFGYRGTATTGLRAAVRSTGQKAFVARLLEDGFHPRGSTTLVPGRGIVRGILERRHDQIVDGIADSIDKATRNAGWH